MTPASCNQQPFTDEQTTDSAQAEGCNDSLWFGDPSDNQRPAHHPDDEPTTDCHRYSECDIAVATDNYANSDEYNQTAKDESVSQLADNRAVGRSHRQRYQQPTADAPHTEQMSRLAVVIAEIHTSCAATVGLKPRKFCA